MNYKVDIYNEFSPNLRSIWLIIENECDHYVFQSYDWLSHWHQTVGANHLNMKLCIVVVSDKSNPVALFPFGIRNCLGAKVLELLGGDQSDYNSPLISRDYSGKLSSVEIWKTVKNYLPAHDIQQFVKLPEYVNQMKNPIFNFWDCTKVDKAYSAVLPESWEIYYKNIPNKIRSDSRRQLRRLSEIGKVQYIIGNIDKDYNKYLSVMFHQKSQRYQNTGARDLFAIEAIRMFYSGLCNTIGTNGCIHFSVLLVDSDVVATHWGAVYGDRFYFLLPTYSLGHWSRFSPGRLLEEKLIEWSISEKLGFFDFTTGGEEYKKNYCNHNMYIFRMIKLVRIYGMVFIIIELLISYIKRNKISRKYFMKFNKLIFKYLKR